MRSSRAIWTRLPRPLVGLAALILYGFCALGLPALHLSAHERPHDHLPQGLRLHPLAAAHLLAGAEHDESTADHSHDLRSPRRPLSHGPTWSRSQRALPSLGLHGQGSLAHFAAGYLAVRPGVAPAARPGLLTLPPPPPLTSHSPPPPDSPHAPRAPPILGS